MSPDLNQFVIYPSLVEFKSKNDAQLHSMILPPYCLKFKTGDNDALEYEAQVRDFQIFHQMPERFEKMGKKLVNNKSTYAEWEKCMHGTKRSLQKF